MTVVDLGEVHRQRRAAIADALLATHALRAMQVAQRHIGDVVGEQAGRERLFSTHQDRALAVLGHLAVTHMGMAHGDQRLAGLAGGTRSTDQLLVHAGHAVAVGLAAGAFGLACCFSFLLGLLAAAQAGDLGRAQEGYRQTQGAALAVTIMQGHQQMLAVETVGIAAVGGVIHPAHAPQRMGLESCQQRGRQLDARAGIVIAGDHHDLQRRVLLVGAHDEVVEQLLGGQARVDHIEQVSGDQQRIRRQSLELPEQPVEKGSMLDVSALAVKALAEMPVGSVQKAEAHDGVLAKSSGRRLGLELRMGQSRAG